MAPAEKRERRSGPRGAWGIRWRLALLAGIAVVVVMSVAGALVERSYTSLQFDEVCSRSAALLESFAVPCAIEVATRDLEALDDFMDEVARAGGAHLGIRHVAMLNHEGRILAEGYPPMHGEHDAAEATKALSRAFYSEARTSAWALWRRTTDTSGAPVLLVSMPAISGLRWGTLVANIDLQPFTERVRRARWVLVMLTVVLAATVCGVLFFGLWRIVVRPVRALAGVAASIRGGDLDARVEIYTPDELGELGGTFNSMAEELKSYTSSLEEKVEVRTQALHAKNRELGEVNLKLEAAVEKLDKLARTDALTGVFNRGHFMETLNLELQRSQRTGEVFSVILCDVDHFKKLNDTYGHLAGDIALVGVTDILQDAVRQTDTVARYGGEEFVVLLVGTALEAGVGVAESIRRAIEGFSFCGPDGESLGRVTISLGVSVYPDHGVDGIALLRCADDALYKAKRGGRNQVVAGAV